MTREDFDRQRQRAKPITSASRARPIDTDQGDILDGSTIINLMSRQVVAMWALTFQSQTHIARQGERDCGHGLRGGGRSATQRAAQTCHTLLETLAAELPEFKKETR